MGTTAEKGARVLQSIAEVQEGINNLGGSLTDQTPFKDFKTELDNIYDTLPKTEFQEGTDVTIEGGLKGKLDYDNGVVGIGQTEQDGTPTPSTPVAIQCVTGNQEIVESGKNLFEPVISIDGTQIVGNNMPNLGVTDGEFSFTANGADAYFGQVSASGSTYTANRGIKIYRNGNEKISYKISNTEINRNFITAYDSNGTSLGYVEKSGSSQGTYVFPTNCDFVTFRIGKGNAVSGTIYKFNVMVAYGDTIPDYEPYHTPITYPISLGNNKFYKIGDYADELLYDVDEDKVYKKAYIRTKVWNGSEDNWGQYVSNPNGFYNNTIMNVAGGFDGYCDYFVFENTSTTWTSAGKCGFGPTHVFWLIHTDTSIDTLEKFKTWLTTHNVLVVYISTEPILTELTDTTLKAQVKALYNAHSLNGTTILESNGDLPMIIKVRALKGE